MQTVWVYKAGNRVYELHSPKGETYIMQSFSMIVDRRLNIDQLKHMSARLNVFGG
jgi:hypothetical protein